jgi:hypothetical protein
MIDGFMRQGESQGQKIPFLIKYPTVSQNSAGLDDCLQNPNDRKIYEYRYSQREFRC